MRSIVLLLAIASRLAAQPTVAKVEPPNWWTRTTLPSVRVLIRGTSLAGARVAGDLRPDRVTVNGSGTYLMVDLHMPRGTRAGPHPLTLTTGQGSAIAPFELLEPLTPAGRFAGVTPDDLVYLIMPDRFSNGDRSNDDPAVSHGLFNPAKPRYYHGGDLKGIRDHLAYFKELGITALWLNPWYDNVNHLNEREKPDGEPITDYHGYGAIDFYGVEEHFGSLAELRELVDAAHAQGIRIIQDEVANHTGPYHPWVEDPPTPTWFHGTANRHITETWQLWPLIDPHATPELQAKTLNGWFADILPDLNQDDPEVKTYLVQNTLWWIGITGLDAIRMDTLPYVPRSFWHEWTAAITREYPKVNIIGEVFDADPAITSFFPEGALSVFDFPNYFKVREVFIKGKTVRDLAGMLGHDGLYRDPEMLGTFIDNHDVMRFLSEENASVDKLKLAFTWLLTTRGIPMIYYGDEIGMRGGKDPDNRRDFPESAFAASTRTAEQQSLWAHVAGLAHVRAATPALRNGATRTLCATEQQWVYARVLPEQTVLVEINNADEPASIPCAAKRARTLFGTGAFGDKIPAHSARVSMASGLQTFD